MEVKVTSVPPSVPDGASFRAAVRMRRAGTPLRVRRYLAAVSARAWAKAGFSPLRRWPVSSTTPVVSSLRRAPRAPRLMIPVLPMETLLARKSIILGTLRVTANRPVLKRCWAVVNTAADAADTTRPCTRGSHWYLAWLARKYFFSPTVSSMALLHTFSSISWNSRIPSRYSFTSIR